MRQKNLFSLFVFFLMSCTASAPRAEDPIHAVKNEESNEHLIQAKNSESFYITMGPVASVAGEKPPKGQAFVGLYILDFLYPFAKVAEIRTQKENILTVSRIGLKKRLPAWRTIKKEKLPIISISLSTTIDAEFVQLRSLAYLDEDQSLKWMQFGKDPRSEDTLVYRNNVIYAKTFDVFSAIPTAELADVLKNIEPPEFTKFTGVNIPGSVPSTLKSFMIDDLLPLLYEYDPTSEQRTSCASRLGSHATKIFWLQTEPTAVDDKEMLRLKAFSYFDEQMPDEYRICNLEV